MGYFCNDVGRIRLANVIDNKTGYRPKYSRGIEFFRQYSCDIGSTDIPSDMVLSVCRFYTEVVEISWNVVIRMITDQKYAVSCIWIKDRGCFTNMFFVEVVHSQQVIRQDKTQYSI